MSFGGFGAQGTIRYALIVDDAQANAKIGTFKSSLTSLAPATQQVNTQMGALSNNFKGVSGGLTQQNTLIGQSVTQHQSLGSQIKTNIGNFSNLAIGISATATSVLNLAAGFRDYNDAQIQVERVTRRVSVAHESLTKAQAKLNDLQSKGVTSGKDYQQAQLDVQQAQQQLDIQTQLLGESQERLFDSQSQFVVSVVPTVLGAVGSLGAAFQTFGGKLDGIGGTLGKLKGSLLGTSEGFGGLKGSMIGILGPAGLAAAAALLIIDRMEAMKESLKKAGVQVTQTSKSFIQALADMDLAKFNSEMKQSMFEFDNVNRLMKTTPWHLATTGIEQLRKEITAAGGVFDKTGKLMEVTKEHTFDLGSAFKDSSNKWIEWMTNYLKAGQSHEQIMAKLKAATFDEATATKIAAAAEEDYANWKKASAEKTAETTKATEAGTKATAAATKGTIAFNQHTSETIDILNRLHNLVGGTLYNDMVRFDEVMNIATFGEQLSGKTRETFNSLVKTAEDTTGLITSTVNGMVDLVKKREPEWTAAIAEQGIGLTNMVEKMMEDAGNKAVEFRNKLAEEARKANEAFAAEFEKKPLTDKIFKIEGKPEKMVEKFIDSLPKDLKKKVKIGAQLEIKAEDAKVAFKEIQAQFLNFNQESGLFQWDKMVVMNDKDATTVGKKMILAIDKQFGGHENVPQEWRNFQTLIAEAAGSSNPMAAIVKAMNSPQAKKLLAENPIPVKIVASEVDLSKFSGSKSSGFSGFEGGGFSGEAWGEPKVSIPIKGVVTQVGYQQVDYSGNKTYKSGTGTLLTKGSEEEKQYYKTHPEEKPPGDTGTGGFDVKQIQTVQKALQSLATYGIKNLQALAKAASTNFNTVANYANGATTHLQTLQKAIQSLVTYGVKNIASLGKTSATNFNTVANYADGATTHLQTLQTAVGSLTKYGASNLKSLASTSSTQMNGFANNVDKGTQAVQDLQSAIDSLQSKTVTVTVKTSLTGNISAGLLDKLMG